MVMQKGTIKNVLYVFSYRRLDMHNDDHYHNHHHYNHGHHRHISSTPRPPSDGEPDAERTRKRISAKTATGTQPIMLLLESCPIFG
jgi:hypothetical protein